MRANVSREMLTLVHQHGSLEPLTTAQELDLPHSGQSEVSSFGSGTPTA